MPNSQKKLYLRIFRIENYLQSKNTDRPQPTLLELNLKSVFIMFIYSSNFSKSKIIIKWYHFGLILASFLKKSPIKTQKQGKPPVLTLSRYNFLQLFTTFHRLNPRLNISFFVFHFIIGYSLLDIRSSLPPQIRPQISHIIPTIVVAVGV